MSPHLSAVRTRLLFLRRTAGDLAELLDAASVQLSPADATALLGRLDRLAAYLDVVADRIGGAVDPLAAPPSGQSSSNTLDSAPHLGQRTWE